MSMLVTFRVDEIQWDDEYDDVTKKLLYKAGSVSRESVKSFLLRNSSAHCVCYEISEKTKKPHYQGWAYTDCSEQTWKNRIKAEWPGLKGTKRGRGTGKYSGAPVRNMDSYRLYVLKGTPTELPDVVTCQFQVNEELDIEGCHRLFWSQRTSVDTVREREQHVVDDAISFFQNYAWGDGEEDVRYRRNKVCVWLVQRMKELGKKSYDSFRTRTWLNAICISLFSEFEELFISEVCSKI